MIKPVKQMNLPVKISFAWLIPSAASKYADAYQRQKEYQQQREHSHGHTSFVNSIPQYIHLIIKSLANKDYSASLGKKKQMVKRKNLKNKV